MPAAIAVALFLAVLVSIMVISTGSSAAVVAGLLTAVVAFPITLGLLRSRKRRS